MNRHIDSIHIQDFQNHQDTHIKLVPGLNIITGSSDSGKSAIVRALDLAFLDTFRKQDVRDGQKNSHVTINFRNGDTYKRIYDLEEAATLLGSDINKLSVDIKRLNTDIENTKKKLEPFENLDLKLKTIEELKNLQSEYESIEQYIQDCGSFFKHFLTLIKEINKCKSDLSVQNELLDFFTNEIPTLEHRYSEIKDGIQLVENIDNAKNNFFKSKIQYEKSYEIAEGQIGSLICDSIKLQTLYSGLYSIEKSIEEVNENIDFSSDKINDEEDIITACNDKIKILLEYLHANFTICETCGKPL